MDFDLEYNNPSCSGEPNFIHGDVWFAFSFGKTGQEPPNDVPNISVIKNRFVFDVTVNAELQPSQKVLIDGIQTRLDEFDRILSKFDDLMLKTYLKYETNPASITGFRLTPSTGRNLIQGSSLGTMKSTGGLSKRNDHAGLNSLSQRIKVLLRDK